MKTILFTKKALFIISVMILSILGTLLLYHGLTTSDWHDFDVFYSAAKAAIEGKSIYIIVGEYKLPFWYFPWTAWLFIPFAMLPQSIALIVYKLSTLLSAILIFNSLFHYYNKNFEFLNKLIIFSLTVPLSLQVMQVGQIEYLFLGFILLTIYMVDKKMIFLTGLAIPFIWIKPHLVIIFTIFVFLRCGYKTILTSIGVFLTMLVIETIINPNWYLEMLSLLQIGQQRTDGLPFITFLSMLGYQGNWIGTANLPFTMLLISIAIIIVWKFRNLPTIPFLSLALTASLFCAPRAYGYDLPLLIPTMIWLTVNDFKSMYWVWLIAGIFPVIVHFASITYLLILLIFILGILKANKALLEIKLINNSLDKVTVDA